MAHWLLMAMGVVLVWLLSGAIPVWVMVALVLGGEYGAICWLARRERRLAARGEGSAEEGDGGVEGR